MNPIQIKATGKALCPPISRMPREYMPMPFGPAPMNWRDEVSGELASAVRAYLNFRIGEAPEPSRAELALLADYFRHYIFAPCWDRSCAGAFEKELAELRDAILGAETAAELGLWQWACLGIGLDPL